MRGAARAVGQWASLARSRPGRLELKRRIGEQLWPRLVYVSGAYRRTLGRRPRIIVVAGSVGKTTTMRATSAVLGLPVSRPALLNMNSHTAVGRALLRVRPWHPRAVLEIGINGPGQMRILAATIRPDVAVVTAVARDHWLSLHTLENTRHEKADIVRALPARGTAVLNADDPNVRWMASQTRARVVLVGEAADADVRATDVELDWPHGRRFTVHAAGQSWPVSTRLLGRQMVYPALAAIAVAQLEGVPMAQAVAALASLEATPGRMQQMRLANGAVVVRDEFKSTIDSWHAALDALAGFPARRRLLVVGELEEVRGRHDYRELGGKAGAIADRLILVGTTDSHQAFRVAAVKAGLDRDRISQLRTHAEALDMLRDELGDGDVVLIKGRWRQGLGRIGLALAGRNVQCRAEPCPFKRMLCDICPMLEQPFRGLPGRAPSEAA